MNKSYTYPHMELWSEDFWKNRGSQTNSLARWIQQKDREHRNTRPVFSPTGTSGKYDSKTHSTPIDEVIARWRDEGMDYRAREMGGMRWVTMLPHGLSADTCGCKILLTLCDMDYANPYWSMEILERYQALCPQAARERVALLFVASDGVEADNTYVRILQESAAIYHLKLDALYLDISTVYAEGNDLKAISGLAEDCIRERQLLGIPVLEITGLWQNRISQVYATVMSPKAKAIGFDAQKMVFSRLGKRMAESMELQAEFTGGEDPRLQDFWKEKGIRYDRHHFQGEPWVTMTPLSADGQSQPLPLIVVMQEVTDDNPHATLIAMSYHYGLLELVAAGEAAVLFFALECPDDNEILCSMIEQAQQHYPIDPRRVYITGHSHNGMYSLIFAQRHPELFAGIATLGNTHGLEIAADKNNAFRLSAKQLETFLQWDMPLININGDLENKFSLGSTEEDRRRELFSLWQTRLHYFDCPAPSRDAFLALESSQEKGRRKTGLPDGHLSTRYLSGYECYAVDVTNNSGKNHLRLVTVEDMIHLNAPIMADLSWEFLRQFSRNPETGRIIEE